MLHNQPIGFKNFPHATNGMQALQLSTLIVIRRDWNCKRDKRREQPLGGVNGLQGGVIGYVLQGGGVIGFKEKA